MLQITDNQIKMTSGDSVQITITIYKQTADKDNEELSIEDQIYSLGEDDVLHFIVLNTNKEGITNKSFNYLYEAYVLKELDKPPVIQKDFKENIICLDPIDTKFLNTGCYLYGVVLEKANGEINTVQSGDFILTQRFF